MTDELVAETWAFVSPCYRALNLTFGVRTTELEVGTFVDHVLSGLRSDEEDPEIWYSLSCSARSTYPLHFGSELVVDAHDKAFAIQTLLWHLNRATVERADPFVVLHAGGVTLSGKGIIISGPSGAGKTTLTAALVRAGCRYLTDEALAIDPLTGLLQPYAKALAIKPGSWDLLAELRPPLTDLSPRVWHVAATDIRAGAIADVAPPSLVLLLNGQGSDEPDAAAMQEIRRSEALIELFGQSFGSASPKSTLRSLGRALERCLSFRASTADLDSTVGCIIERLLALPDPSDTLKPRS